MNFKKSVSFILMLVVVFGLCKNLFMSYAAENSGYVILLNDENAPVSFAGMKYDVESDLKGVSIEFQMTDTHLFKGKQGVELTVICGDKRDTVQIDSSSEKDADLSFFSLNDIYTQIDTYDSHTNVKINFQLTFEEKLKDELVFKMKFIDAAGGLSEEVYYVLYSPAETTEKTTKPKESTTHKLTESSHNSKTTSALSSLDSTERYQKYPNSGNYKYSDADDSAFSLTQLSSDFNSTLLADTSGYQKDTFGLRQIAAIILAVFLVVAAVVYIIIGIKRSKET